MIDTPQVLNDDRTDERPIADGGSPTAGALDNLNVVDRTPETPAIDFPPLGATDGGDHPFSPMELSREALALPVLAALAVAVGVQGSAFLMTSGAQAVAGSVAVPVVAVVAVLLVLWSV